MKRDYQMAHDATTSTSIAGRYLTGMLPATGSRSFLHHDLNSSKYTTYSDGGWHLHNGAILHIPDGAITQEIYPNDTGYMDFAMNGAEHESAYSFSKAPLRFKKPIMLRKQSVTPVMSSFSHYFSSGIQLEINLHSAATLSPRRIPPLWCVELCLSAGGLTTRSNQ